MLGFHEHHPSLEGPDTTDLLEHLIEGIDCESVLEGHGDLGTPRDQLGMEDGVVAPTRMREEEEELVNVPFVFAKGDSS